jgi:hypothetical protein
VEQWYNLLKQKVTGPNRSEDGDFNKESLEV